MFIRKITGPLLHSRRTLYTTPEVHNTYHEYIQFAISGTNCLLIVSILGCMEQYKKNTELMKQCNARIDELFYHRKNLEATGKIPSLTPFIHEDNDS